MRTSPMSYQPEVAAGPGPALGVNTDPKPVEKTQPKQLSVREWGTWDLHAVIELICKNEEIIRHVYRIKQRKQRSDKKNNKRSVDDVNWFAISEELARQLNISFFGKSKAETHERRVQVRDVRHVLSYIMTNHWSAVSYVEEQSPPYRISRSKTMAFARMNVDFNRKLRVWIEKVHRESQKRREAQRTEELRKRSPPAVDYRASLDRGFSNKYMGAVVRSLHSARRRRAIYSSSPTPAGRNGRTPLPTLPSRRGAHQSELVDESLIDPRLRSDASSERQSFPSSVSSAFDSFSPEPRQISVPATGPPTPYPQSDTHPRQQAPHPDIYLRDTPLSPVPSLSLGSPVSRLPTQQHDEPVFPETNSYPDPSLFAGAEGIIATTSSAAVPVPVPVENGSQSQYHHVPSGDNGHDADTNLYTDPSLPLVTTATTIATVASAATTDQNALQQAQTQNLPTRPDNHDQNNSPYSVVVDPCGYPYVDDPNIADLERGMGYRS